MKHSAFIVREFIRDSFSALVLATTLSPRCVFYGAAALSVGIASIFGVLDARSVLTDPQLVATPEMIEVYHWAMRAVGVMGVFVGSHAIGRAVLPFFRKS